MYKNGITMNEYTFSDSDWEMIIQASGGNASTVYKWIVIGYNDKAPIMPLAGGRWRLYQQFSHLYCKSFSY